MDYKILHIASHYGGGVGTIINAWIKKDTKNSHTLTYLNNVPENKKENQNLLDPAIMSEYDFCIVHVWNHPSLFDFLINTKKPDCRLIGWSHMAGLHAPYILFDKLIDYFDYFCYTSPVSHYSNKIKPVIWSTGDMTEFQNITPRFKIGYIGTLDFCKLSWEFVEICKNISIPEARFIIIGSGSDENTIINEFKKSNFFDRVDFIGYSDNIIQYLDTIDVFLYPLTEKHFGTCEQILGEVLSAGIPVIVLDNYAEKFIIKDGINGFVCKNKEEIAQKIKLIYDKKFIFDPKKNKRNGKKFI